ncbi:MAG: hypothetical protein Q9224_005521, partial [Gallowayella concinna]
PAQSRPAPTASGKKRERDGDEDASQDGPRKRVKPATHYQPPSAQSLQAPAPGSFFSLIQPEGGNQIPVRKPIIRKETVLVSKTAVPGKSQASKLGASAAKRHRQIAPRKREQIRAPKNGKLTPWSPAAAAAPSASGQTERTESNEVASITVSPKRKMEDEIAPAAKKQKVGQHSSSTTANPTPSSSEAHHTTPNAGEEVQHRTRASTPALEAALLDTPNKESPKRKAEDEIVPALKKIKADHHSMNPTLSSASVPAITPRGAENTVSEASGKDALRRGAASEKPVTADESFLKKHEIDSPAVSPTVAFTPHTTVVENGTPVLHLSKRKAEDDIELPRKKQKDKQPTNNVASMAASINAGKVNLHNGGRGAGFDKIKNGGSKEAKRKEGQQDPTTTSEEQTLPDTGRRPAPMANQDYICYANTILQTIDSIPELRDRLIALASKDDGAAFPVFPVPKGFKEDDAEAEAAWHENINQILNDQDRTFGQCLGQTLRHMRASGGKRVNVCIRGLMKMFSGWHDGYDGASLQQEAFDFLDKVLERLEAEDIASGDLNEQGISPVRELFGGQKFTRLECNECGDKRDNTVIDTYSLQLQFPSGNRACRRTTIPSCLEKSLGKVEVHGVPCEPCGETSATYKMKDYIKSWGKYLILHLDRARSSDEKLDTQVLVPSSVDLGEYVLNPGLPAEEQEKPEKDSTPQVRYERVAVIEHEGDW